MFFFSWLCALQTQITRLYALPPSPVLHLIHHNSISHSFTRIRSTPWAATGDPLTTSIRSRSPSSARPSPPETRNQSSPVNHSPCWVWPPYLSASCGSPFLLTQLQPEAPEAGAVCQASSWLRQALVPVVPSAWNAFPSSHPSPILSPSPGLYTNSASGGISASPLPSHLSFFFSTSVLDPTHSTFNFCILLTVCTPCQLHGGRDLGLFCSAMSPVLRTAWGT